MLHRTRPNSWTKQVREIEGTSEFGLHKILIYAMKNGEVKGVKYLEKEKEENIWRRKIFFW